MPTEIVRVARAAREALAAREDALLATVLRVGGSTYRRPGARLLLTRDAQTGSISGGCLEEDLRQKSWWRTQQGPVVVTYDSTLDDGEGDDDLEWGFGLGCNGVVDVLLERLDEANIAHLDRLERWQTDRRTGVLATTCCAHRLWLDESGASSGDASLLPGAQETLHTRRSVWRDGALFEFVAPPQRLVVFGAGHDVAPVTALAAGLLGWDVVVVDGRSQMLHPERFPGARVFREIPVASLGPSDAVVLMTHSLRADKALLPEVLESGAGYIGLLGPRRRAERLLGPDVFPPQLRAPMGLDIGADNPEEIALSLVAEIRAWAAGRGGGALNLRAGPIH